MSNNDALSIGGRAVGGGSPAFVIAEIGVNHDGSLDTALRLVEAAWEGGADAVKLQLFSASRLLHARAQLADYQRAGGETSPAEMLRRFELSTNEVERLVTAIRQAGMVPIATPFSPENLEQIAALQLPAVKLASPDLVNPLLTDAAADLHLPLILSTGAATGEEIGQAVSRLRQRNASFALLHCVSSYPTPDTDAQLGRIRQLEDSFACVVGVSDHTQNLSAGAIAVANGARIVEKHLTYNRAARGPDHSASADPTQFREYVHRIREAESLLGVDRLTDHRQVLNCERDVRHQSRQSLVARRTIAPGEIVTRDALTCQRPGTGIPAAELDRVVGLRAIREVSAGAMLDWADLNVTPSLAAA